MCHFRYGLACDASMYFSAATALAVRRYSREMEFLERSELLPSSQKIPVRIVDIATWHTIPQASVLYCWVTQIDICIRNETDLEDVSRCCTDGCYYRMWRRSHVYGHERGCSEIERGRKR